MKPIARHLLHGLAGTCLLLLSLGSAAAAPVEIPNAFVNGEVTDADLVNENFAAIQAAVNDNDTRLATAEAGLETAQAEGDSQAAAIAALQGGTQLQVLEVAEVSGNPLASGNELLGTVASIVDASAAKLYLVKIGAGTFDLGTQTLALQPFVFVEGSGEGSFVSIGGAERGDPSTLAFVGGTVIRGSGTATVAGAANSALGNLGVENTEGNPAIANSGVDFRISHVAVLSVVAAGAVATAIQNSGTLRLANSAVYAFGSTTLDEGAAYGLRNDAGSATIHSSTIWAQASSICADLRCDGIRQASGTAVFNTGTPEGVVAIHQSDLTGGASSVFNDTDYTLNVVSSRVSGVVSAIGGTAVQCFFSYTYGTTNVSVTDLIDGTPIGEARVAAFLLLGPDCLVPSQALGQAVSLGKAAQ